MKPPITVPNPGNIIDPIDAPRAAAVSVTPNPMVPEIIAQTHLLAKILPEIWPE